MSLEYIKYKELDQNSFENNHIEITSLNDINIFNIKFENEMSIESNIFQKLKHIKWNMKSSAITLVDYPLYIREPSRILICELHKFEKDIYLKIQNNHLMNNLEKITFKNCIFNKEITIIDRNINSITFIDCTFEEDIYKLLRKKYSNPRRVIFDNCKVSHFKLWNISTDYPLQEFEFIGGKIEHCEIVNKNIKSKFYINKQYSGNDKLTKITKLIIKNTTFKKNFKLHNCQVTNILLEDIDFHKHADFFESTFQQCLPNNDEKKENSIHFKAINFKGLALFGDCKFSEKLIFKYVTFEGYSHFRRTEFKKGLDLDYTNIQEEMNFFGVEELDSQESKKNTSQETYRIIKHNFEKIENKIEANKYHSLELEKRKTDKSTPKSEKFILQLHWLTSRNGTNWWIPLLLIFFVGFITYIGLHWQEYFSYYPQTQTTSIEKSFLGTFKHIYILYKYKDLWDTHPILLAFNKFSLGYLYYQFLIAVRKDTRK